MYRKAKRDSNERAIIELAEKLGASVVQLDDPHVPDLLIGFLGYTLLSEIKTRAGKLTHGQTDFMASWKGQVIVIRSQYGLLRLLARTAEERMRPLPPSLAVKAFQQWIVAV